MTLSHLGSSARNNRITGNTGCLTQLEMNALQHKYNRMDANRTFVCLESLLRFGSG